jgi:hypothetical protein
MKTAITVLADLVRSLVLSGLAAASLALAIGIGVAVAALGVWRLCRAGWRR